jgi:2-methylcitrate dehydratase PrpD
MTARSDATDRPLALRLAEKICAFESRDASATALQQARIAVIDTVGVTLAGMPEPAPQILLKTPGIAPAAGSALVFATSRRTSALDATLVNGTASHALDFDDFNGVMGGHHSVTVIPAVLALAEERGYRGRQILDAYLVGVETEMRLGRAVNFHHYDKGWHPTATLGVFAAAAASARLIGLNAERTATALAIAASLASGIKANFGTMTKPLHVGQCGRNGLFAALAAEQGFDASPVAFEHHQGFLDVFNGPGTYDAEQALENWGQPLEIEGESIALKQFPCCGSTHPAIMMMLKLVAEENVQPDQVARVEVMPHRRRLRHTDNPDPKSPLEAKFSVQYAVARALVDGTVRLKDFEGDAHKEPSVRRIMAVTEASPHPDMADDASEQWGAEVIVTMQDGQQLSRRVDDLVGRSRKNPMTPIELWEKFEDCAKRALPQDRIAPLFERLETLDSMNEVGQLTRLLEVRTTPQMKPGRQPAGVASRTHSGPPETTWVP